MKKAMLYLRAGAAVLLAGVLFCLLAAGGELFLGAHMDIDGALPWLRAAQGLLLTAFGLLLVLIALQAGQEKREREKFRQTLAELKEQNLALQERLRALEDLNTRKKDTEL